MRARQTLLVPADGCWLAVHIQHVCCSSSATAWPGVCIAAAEWPGEWQGWQQRRHWGLSSMQMGQHVDMDRWSCWRQVLTWPHWSCVSWPHKSDIIAGSSSSSSRRGTKQLVPAQGAWSQQASVIPTLTASQLAAGRWPYGWCRLGWEVTLLEWHAEEGLPWLELGGFKHMDQPMSLCLDDSCNSEAATAKPAPETGVGHSQQSGASYLIGLRTELGLVFIRWQTYLV